jgi:hypothetical protein
MDKNTKIMVQCLSAVASLAVQVSDSQAQTLKLIADLDVVDASLRRRLIDLASKCESGHEKTEAILADLQRALDRR